jgi:hypothetical protein
MTFARPNCVACGAHERYKSAVVAGHISVSALPCPSRGSELAKAVGTCLRCLWAPALTIEHVQALRLPEARFVSEPSPLSVRLLLISAVTRPKQRLGVAVRRAGRAQQLVGRRHRGS